MAAGFSRGIFRTTSIAHAPNGEAHESTAGGRPEQKSGNVPRGVRATY